MECFFREKLFNARLSGWECINWECWCLLLFITVACGACSGFHSIVSMERLRNRLKESDVRRISYGGMLMEGVLAVFMGCVAVLTMSEQIEFGGEIVIRFRFLRMRRPSFLEQSEYP